MKKILTIYGNKKNRTITNLYSNKEYKVSNWNYFSDVTGYWEIVFDKKNWFIKSVMIKNVSL